MSNAVLAVLGAIAAILATIGYLLFGKPKGEETRSVQPVERVQVKPPIVDSTDSISHQAPVAEPVIVEPVIAEPVIAEPVIAKPVIAEPVVMDSGHLEQLIEQSVEQSVEQLVEQSVEQTYGEVGGITLDNVEQPDAIDPNQDLNQAYFYDSIPEAPIELNVDDATQANELIQEPSIEAPVHAEVSTPVLDLSSLAEPLNARRADPVPPMAIALNSSASNPPIQLAPYSTLNDSKRPKNLAAQKLSQQILTWGQSAENANEVISYAQNQDPMIRKYVAQSLMLMVKHTSDRSALFTVISTLEVLSHDSDQGVKAIAQSGLGV